MYSDFLFSNPLLSRSSPTITISTAWTPHARPWRALKRYYQARVARLSNQHICLLCWWTIVLLRRASRYLLWSALRNQGIQLASTSSYTSSFSSLVQYLTSISLIHRYAIQDWLHWLKHDCGLRASAFMVDCAKTESEAISSVFPHSKIFYCNFHVAQLWEKHLKQKISVRVYASVALF